MALYVFGDPADIQEGRLAGRSVLPKKFKSALIDRYGSIDCITGAKLNERILQIDHRIPYRIAGDAGLIDQDVECYMLLDASSQRGKSWSCEHCPNMMPAARNETVCMGCFWAFPESYWHIAMVEIRRTDIVWQGADIEVYERLKAMAESSATSIAELLRVAGRQIAKNS